MNKIIIIFTLIFLTACYSVKHYKFDDYRNMDGNTEQSELERVFAECEVLGEQSKAESEDGLMKRIYSYNKIVDACMRSKGFKRFSKGY